MLTLIGGATGLFCGYVDFIAWDIRTALQMAKEFFECSDIPWASFHTFRREAGTVNLKTPPEKEPDDKDQVPELDETLTGMDYIPYTPQNEEAFFQQLEQWNDEDEYGYKLVRLGRVNKKGHDLFDLAINEEETAIVVFIFKKCAIEGKGAQSIANLLNQMGIKNRAGKNWHPSSVRNILRNIMYVGILRSGAYHSDIIPELQIITPELFMEVQEIIYQRSNAYEKQRRIPRNTRGQSLLAGNVFCGHCGARLCLTTNGKGRPRADGTDTVRVRYTCQTKSRKHEPCDGQTGYTLTILEGMIDDIIHQVLRYVKSVSKAEILAAGYQVQMGEQKAIVNKAQREYEKARNDLQVLNAEIVNALTGNSAFTPDMLKEAIARTEEKCAALEQDYELAKRALDDSEAYLEKLSTRYDRFVEWSDIYDTATIETKKMIVSQIIERVDVFRDYRLKIKFTISVEQFILGLDISA
ncbi:MAG: recombinase family protein [Oscillibacter sp.]|nr:recombinase family protein [Oscillibacter sp.]